MNPKNLYSVLILSFILFLCAPVLSKTETQTIFSPKCDKDKIKTIGGDAIVKIEAGKWKNGYNVTLDTEKLAWADLTAKLNQENCF